MRSLDFADGTFDLIWCEGAIRVRRADRSLLAQARRAGGMCRVLEQEVPVDSRHGRAAGIFRQRYRRVPAVPRPGDSTRIPFGYTNLHPEFFFTNYNVLERFSIQAILRQAHFPSGTSRDLAVSHGI